MLASRGFGGGLKKFEPRDLLDIPLPDLRCATTEQLGALAESLRDLDQRRRNGVDTGGIEAKRDELVLSLEQSSVPGPPQGTLF